MATESRKLQVLLLAVFASASAPVSAQVQQPFGTGGALTTSLCHYTSGARSGTIVDFGPSATMLLGSACKDGQGSFGYAIAGTAAAPADTAWCAFTSGPRAGQMQSFAGAPAGNPVAGTRCHDGRGSFGTAVAETTTAPSSAHHEYRAARPPIGEGLRPLAPTSPSIEFTSPPRTSPCSVYPTLC